MEPDINLQLFTREIAGYDYYEEDLAKWKGVTVKILQDGITGKWFWEIDEIDTYANAIFNTHKEAKKDVINFMNSTLFIDLTNEVIK